MMQGHVQRKNRTILPKYQKPPPPYPHNAQQAQFHPQPYSTLQARHFNGQHNVVNYWNGHQAVCSDNADFQQYNSQYDGNQSFHQQPVTRHQNYITPTKGTSVTHAGSTQVHATCTQSSDQGNPRTVSNINPRGWSSHYTDNGRPCQQPQPRQDHIYTEHQQQPPGQLWGQQQTVPTSGCNNTVQRITNFQSGMLVGSNSVTLSHDRQHRNNYPPSSNVQQSHPVLTSNANPNAFSAQYQNSPSTNSHPVAGSYVQTCNVNQNAQSEAMLKSTSKPFSSEFLFPTHMVSSLRSRMEEQGLNKNSINHQRSACRAPNMCPDPSFQSVNGFSNVHIPHSQQLPSDPSNVQPAFEPAHKQLNFGQTQWGYRQNLLPNNTDVCKDHRLKSTLHDVHHMTIARPNSPGQQQIEIHYVNDPDISPEAVFASQKTIQHLQKAIAIVSPISQQPPNTEKIDDGCTKSDDSPPLKIDAVCSIAKQSDYQRELNIKLSQDSSPAVQENDRISSEKGDPNGNVEPCVMERSETTFEILPTRCENDISMTDCISSDVTFGLPNIPVDPYTLENLTVLVKSLERMESSSQCPENPKNICNQILDIYWNGDIEFLKRGLKELRKEGQKFDRESVKDYKSVVFESISLENVKKLPHCEIVTDKLCSSFEQYKSSWLNIYGQPTDIDKILSEPLSDYITLPKEVTYNICFRPENIGVNSLKDCEVTAVHVNEHVKPDSKSPERISTPSEENIRMDKDNKGHSNAQMSGVMSLCSVLGEKKLFREQVDDMHYHKSLNALPPTDLTLSEVQRDTSTSKENLRQKPVMDNLTVVHKESVSLNLVHGNTSVSDLCPVNPEKSLQLVKTVLDENSHPLSTKPISNFKDTWQIEDISEDGISDNMDIGTVSADTSQVEDISEDKNFDKMNSPRNSPEMLQAKDISDGENSDSMKVFTNPMGISQQDIFEDSDYMEVVPNSTDRVLVEDISNDENSENDDDSFEMDVIVMSAEEALAFFQPLEKQCQSDIKMRSDVSRELFGYPCLDMAPLLNLELDPCSPKSNDTDLEVESENLKCVSSPPPLEVLEPVIDLTDTHMALTERPKYDTVLNSVAENKSPVEQDLASIQPDETKDENISMPESKKLEDGCSPPSLKVLGPVIASTAVYIADEKTTEKTKDDTVVDSVPEKKPGIQSTVKQVTKIRPDENPEKIKPAKMKRKMKPIKARLYSEDPVLFAPDIVVKNVQPQKKKPSHPRAGIADNSPKMKVSPEGQESYAVTLQNHKEKVNDKALKDHKTLYRSNTLPEKMSEKKMTTGEKKVKFALFGSKNEQQRAIPGRAFLPPATLTMSEACQNSKDTQCSPPGRRLSLPPDFNKSTCNDYSTRISAKQKVHDQWSSTFIPKGKKTSPLTSPPKGEPPKKKLLKAHELLKSNMPELKNQMMQRTVRLSSQNVTRIIQ